MKYNPDVEVSVVEGKLVSVIIATYQRSFQILERAVKSVLNQTYENLELIVVDDNDPDSPARKEVSTSIRNISDFRLRYIEGDKNRGACAARNIGINCSHGDYIAFLDDDDEYLPRNIEVQLSGFEDSNVGLTYCDFKKLILSNNKIIAELDAAHKRYSGYVFNELLYKNFIGSVSFVIIRRAVIENIGLFNESLKSSQDFEYWLRISKHFPIKFIETQLVNYYAHDEPRISNNMENKIQGNLAIRSLYYEDLKKDKKSLYRHTMKIVPYYIKNGDIGKATTEWWTAVRLYPFRKENFLNALRIIRSLV